MYTKSLPTSTCSVSTGLMVKWVSQPSDLKSNEKIDYTSFLLPYTPASGNHLHWFVTCKQRCISIYYFLHRNTTSVYSSVVSFIHLTIHPQFFPSKYILLRLFIQLHSIPLLGAQFN